MSDIVGPAVDAATNFLSTGAAQAFIDLAITVLLIYAIYVIYVVVDTFVNPPELIYGETDLAAGEAGDLPEAVPVSATEGAKMTRSCGRRMRVPGTIIWLDDVENYKEEVEIQEVPTEIDRYRVNMAISWGQSFGGVNGEGRMNDIVVVLFNGKVVWKKNKESKFDHRWESWTNYTGSQTQNADSLLEEKIGANRVSGMRDTAYSVVEGMRLEDFGNGIPVSISAIVQPDDDGYEISDAIRDIYDRQPNADSSTEIDVSAVTGKNTIAINYDEQYLFEGYRKIGPRSAIEMIEQFIPIFDLTVRQSGDKIQFLDRGDEPVVAVEAGHLGAIEFGRDPMRPLELVTLSREQRPSEVIVNFLSKKHRYQRSSERYKINEADVGENIVTLNYEGVLLPKQARRIAKRRVIEAYRLDKNAKCVLAPDYAYLDAGDVIAVPFEGQVYYIRCQSVTVGANYLVEVEGVVEQVRAGEDEILSTGSSDLGTDTDDPDSEDDDPDIDDPEGDDDGGYDPPLMRQAPMNLPAIFKDKDAKDTGIYYSHCAEDPTALFKGSKTYLSWKATGGGFKLFGMSLKESAIGIAVNEFADSTAGPGHFIDRATTLRVQMLEGIPESATREEVESGVNWIAVGSIANDNFEIAAFQTATAVGEVIVDVSGEGLTADDSFSRFVIAGIGVDFTDDVEAGMWIRFDGFTEEANGVLRKVLSVTATEVFVDATAVPLVFETMASGIQSFTVNSGTYDLSVFFRGLRDTFDHCATHDVGDLVVFLRESYPSFVPLPKGKIKKTIRTKSVPKGADLGDVLSEEMDFQGETMRPFRPCWFKWEREYLGGDELDDYDIHLSWVHRTRFPFPDPTSEAVPHADLDHEGKQDEYEIRIYSDSGKTTLVRSFTVTAPDDHDVGDEEGRREKTYTVSQQEDDGVKNDELWGEIWQVGTIVKKGNVLDFNIPAV